jgi:putative aldouronate transport system permease protein
MNTAVSVPKVNKPKLTKILAKDFKKNYPAYLMILPVIIYYIIFHYGPMYGVIIAFKNYVPTRGILGSTWVGFSNFIDFFKDIYFFRVIKNTILLNVYGLIFGFPAPIILALLLNEIKSTVFKRTIQTITYMPHFISLVVICGMIRQFTLSDGLINDILAFFGGERTPFLQSAKYFRTIVISTDIWQGIGWGTIIYLSAITGIDTEQYEAAYIDGANRFRRMWNITLPGIFPTIIILFILKMGNMMSVGYEKIILLYNPATYETADVISSYVFRKGLEEFNWSFSTAVGLFNSVINFSLIILSNTISKKINETSLW